MTPLEAFALADNAWRECEALEPVLGPCTMPRPDPRDYGLEPLPQELPELVVQAGPPWILLGALAAALLAGVAIRSR